MRIKTKIAKSGQIEGTAEENTRNIWKRTARRPARNAAAVAAAATAAAAADQENAGISPVHELWVVLRPPKELGLGRH